ncbi:MAG: guanylate kinase [Desulfobacterales bacterium]|jgi:guanylate kinase|nr:guanylate kinase [Desulfobacterales bacterium]
MADATGKLIIVSAPSGGGKTTLCRALRRRMPDLGYSVSFTTRPPRPGEQDGVDYHFIDVEEFEKGIAEKRWAEWAVVHGNLYGTSAEYLQRALADGEDILLDIDTEGTRQLLAHFPDSLTIFIEPPSMKVLAQRLADRGTDEPEVVARRLRDAEKEMAQRDMYRHRIINGRLDATLNALTALVAKERTPTGRGE